MNISQIIKNELKEKKKTAKWLYEQVNELEPIGSYQRFSEKLKENKLSASDLLYSAHILSIDLNRFTSVIKSNMAKVSQQKGGKLNQNLMIQNSAYQNEGTEHIVYEKGAFSYLISYSEEQDFLALEKFCFATNTVQTYTYIQNVSIIDDAFVSNIGDFKKYITDVKFEFLFQHGKDYQAVFPEDYEEECPLRSLVLLSEDEKDAILNKYRLFKGIECIRRRYKEDNEIEMVLSFNYHQNILGLQWFDFSRRETSVQLYVRDWSSNEDTSPYYENFLQLSDEEQLKLVSESAVKWIREAQQNDLSAKGVGTVEEF